MQPNAPSTDHRRPYVRDTEENRREALIAATKDLVAEGGPSAATVRAIAARAGVTLGLIRHYFGSKDALLHAAYESLMGGMTDLGFKAMEEVGADPAARLRAFIEVSLKPPVVDIKALGLWAGFMHRVQSDPELLAQHKAGYLRFRNQLQILIQELKPSISPQLARQEAIACTALVDGLWLEGSALPDDFAQDEIIDIGLRGVSALLGTRLEP